MEAIDVALAPPRATPSFAILPPVASTPDAGPQTASAVLEWPFDYLEGMAAGLVACDVHGRITHLNGSAEALLEIDARGWQGLDVDDLLAGSPQVSGVPWQQVLVSGVPARAQRWMRGGPGRVASLQIDLGPIWDEDGKPEGVVMLVGPMSGRAEAESELQLPAWDLARINGAAQAVSQGLALQRTLNTALEAAVQVVNAVGAAVWLVDKRGSCLVMMGSRGLSERELGSCLQLEGPASALLAGHPQQAESAATGDVRDLPDGLRKTLPVPNGSYVATGLRCNGRRIGLLLLVAPDLQRPSRRQLRHLAAIADQVAALAHSRGLIAQLLMDRRLRAALQEGVHAITGATETPELLRLLVTGACELVGVNRACLYLLDADRLFLRKALSNRFIDGVMPAHFVELGREPAYAQVIKTRRPVLVVNAQGNPHLLRDAAVQHNVQNMLIVPLVARGEVIGVLCLHDTREAHNFTKQEQELALAFCGQAAISIERARLREAERETIAGLQGLKDATNARSAVLEQVIAMHSELGRLALKQVGVEAMGASLARLLDRPVLVLDSDGLPISCADRHGGEVGDATTGQTAVERAWPDDVKEQLDRVDREFAEVRLRISAASDGERICAVAALSARGDPLGHLVVIGDDGAFGESEHRVVQHAAPMFAMELARAQTVFEVEQRLKGNLFDDLLSGKYDSVEAMVKRAGYLDYDLSALGGVVVVEVDDLADFACRNGERQCARIKRKLLGAISGVVERAGSKSICIGRNGHVIVLLAEPNMEHPLPAAAALSEALREQIRWQIPQITVSLGMGRRCVSPKDAAASYYDARAILNLIRALGKRDIGLSFDDLKPYHLLLCNNSRQELLGFVEEVLTPLERYDTVRHTDLVKTIATYFQRQRDLRQAATELFVHVNTLLHRLQKVEELLGVDLRNLDDQLKVQIALKIRQLLVK